MSKQPTRPRSKSRRSTAFGRWLVAFLGAAGLGALLWLSKPWQQSTIDSGAPALTAARSHLEAGRTAPAREQLHGLLASDPRHREARRLLVALEFEQGRSDHAFLNALMLTELHPRVLEGWWILARIAHDMRRAGAVEASTSQILVLDPGQPAARRLRAEARFARKRFYSAQLDAAVLTESHPAETAAWPLLIRTTTLIEGSAAALETARRALAAHPNDPRLTELQAQLASGERVAPQPRSPGQPPPAEPALWPGPLRQRIQDVTKLMQAEQWPEAEAAVGELARQYPHSFLGPWLAGTVAASRGELAKAEARWRAGLAQAPRSERLAASLAWAWTQLKHARHAGDQLAALSEADPGFSRARLLAMQHYMHAREPVLAEQVLRQGLAAYPEDSESFRRLAQFLLELDRPRDAAAVTRRGLEEHPQEPELLLLRAQLAERGGDRVAAIAGYRETLSRQSDNAVAARSLARLRLDGDAEARKEALSLVRRFAVNAPEDPLTQDVIGWVLLSHGQHEQAQAWLEAAANAAPQVPRIRYHLGVLYLGQGRASLARSELEAALAAGVAFDERLETRRLLRSLADEGR